MARGRLSELYARQGGFQQQARPKAVPLPFGGINLAAPEGTLKPGQARKVLNMLPIDGKMQLRQGYTVAATRTAPVSIVGYDLPSASGMLAVDGGGSVFRYLPSGSITPITYTGLSSTKQLMAATNSGRLCIVDGVNAGIKLFDGSAITNALLTGPYASDVWAGITAHQNRLYLWKEGSLDFWYLGTDAIQGEPILFELSFLGRLRGSIRAMASWTTDAGQGTNDLLAIITTMGDVAIYEGSNPGDAFNWRLNGVYKTSLVAGADTWVNVGGDLRIATQQGIVSASEMLSAGELAAATTTKPSRGVMQYFRDAADVANKERYWQAFLDPKGYGAWFNMPTASGSRQILFASETGTPFEYNLPAVEFARGGTALWFTTVSGQICRFYDTFADAGNVITSEWHSDFMDMQGASMEAVRFSFKCAQDVELSVAVLADMREATEAIDEVIQDWTLQNLDGVADEELPVLGDGDALQIRLTVRNVNSESIKWQKTSIQPVSTARTR